MNTSVTLCLYVGSIQQKLSVHYYFCMPGELYTGELVVCCVVYVCMCVCVRACACVCVCVLVLLYQIKYDIWVFTMYVLIKFVVVIVCSGGSTST